MTSKQVVSKKRVKDHGEVYTAAREVNAMLDLVKSETDRIESRFLEPACGNGNFLAEILTRKLAVVENQYAGHQGIFELSAIHAISSIYGVDILQDNVEESRARLLAIFNEIYQRLFGTACNVKCIDAARYILKCNIVNGNTLTYLNNLDKPFVFACWNFEGATVLRNDFYYGDLVTFITPPPLNVYKPVHFLEVQYV